VESSPPGFGQRTASNYIWLEHITANRTVFASRENTAQHSAYRRRIAKQVLRRALAWQPVTSGLIRSASLISRREQQELG
jgi:hypothetical protein